MPYTVKQSDPGGVFSHAVISGESATPSFDRSSYGGAIANGLDQTAYNAGAGTGFQQSQLAQMLMQQARGGGPNIAQQQFQNALNQSLQGQASALASHRGINSGLDRRMLLNEGAASGASMAGQSALLRMQQQLAAQQLGASVLQGERGLDINQQGANTQLLGTLAGAQNTQGSNDINAQLGADRLNADVAAANAGAANHQQEQLGNAGAATAGSIINASGAALSVAKWRGGTIPSYRDSGRVPGKAVVPGDSPRNDTVDAKLSPGEVVLPRSVVNAPDAPTAAAHFVAHLRKKHGYADGGQAGSEESEDKALFDHMLTRFKQEDEERDRKMLADSMMKMSKRVDKLEKLLKRKAAA